MIKLLNAGFTRLRKNKLFRLLIIFSIGLAVLMVYTSYRDMKTYGDVVKVEQLMLNYSTIIGIVVAVFTSLFLGVEYSDGAIRNKISIGHKRANIYLSNLIITVMTGVFSYLLLVAVVAMIGIPLFGGITVSFSKLLVLLGCILITVIAYSGIFTFIAMMISNKTITAIVTIMLAFGAMVTALSCFYVLEAPEFIENAIIQNGDTGELEIVQEPNPKYPSETKRKVYQTMLDINPAGQMFQIAGSEAPNLKVLPLYSLGILILFTGTGVALFRKKELK